MVYMCDLGALQEPWENVGVTGKTLLLGAHHTDEEVGSSLTASSAKSKQA